MKFCNECGALWYPKKSIEDGEIVYQCRMCGNTLINESTNEEDLILHTDLKAEDQKIWFVKGKEEN